MEERTPTQRKLWELQSMQAAPLSVKIALTKDRIREWVNEYGEDGVYVSFSGGKDSTVLLTIAREMFPSIKAVYVDTGLEYPEIRDYVRTWDNVEWIRPKMSFKEVIEKYGYPFISKEISQKIYEAKKYGRQYAYDRFDPNSEYNKKYNGRYSCARYAFLLSEDAPMVSHVCCKIMKKNPAHEYEKQTHRKPILATMADESTMRRSEWIKNGCNAFNAKRPSSKPMSFWTEQDVLRFLRGGQIPIASVYGNIISVDEDGMAYDSEFLDVPLKTTGLKRTGCMFCGFGVHMRKPGEGNFEIMKVTHPKQYEWIMKPWKDGGLGYKEVIDWLNEHGNLKIRY